MEQKNEWPARLVTLSFYHPNVGDERFDAYIWKAYNEMLNTAEAGPVEMVSLGDGESWTASNGVTITASFNAPKPKEGEMRGIRGSSLEVLTAEEAYQAGLEKGRREAYFEPEQFDTEYDFELAISMGMSADDVNKRLRNQSKAWLDTLGRRMGLPGFYPPK